MSFYYWYNLLGFYLFVFWQEKEGLLHEIFVQIYSTRVVLKDINLMILNKVHYPNYFAIFYMNTTLPKHYLCPLCIFIYIQWYEKK